MKKKFKIKLPWLFFAGAIVLLLGVSFAWYKMQNRYQYDADEEINKDKVLQLLVAAEKDDNNVKQKLVPFGILTYHHIGPDAKGKYNRWCVYPEIFYQQVNDLKKAGYQFVKLGEAMEKYRSVPSTTLPFAKTVALTFDDGYRDFYTTAYPFLKQNKIPATLFVIIQDIGKSGNVTWEMLEEMQASGLVEIGSHTVHHYNLARSSERNVRAEIFDSKKILDEKLGAKVKVLAYPYGVTSPIAMRLAEEAGYLGAVRVLAGKRPSANNMYTWRRMIAENNDTGEKFLKKLYYAFAVLK